jgi:hypothetical protein
MRVVLWGWLLSTTVAWSSQSKSFRTTFSSQTLSGTTRKLHLNSLALHMTVAPAAAAAEIIGGGRIGSLLAEAGDCVLLGRNDSIDPDKQGQPIFIATRNDALDGIIAACPEHRRQDLVFLQNGYLDSYLESKGLLQNTQVLLYLSVTARGADAIDGVTRVNPEGLTAATGVHARAFQDRLAALHLKCNVVDRDQYRAAMFEKLM